MAKYILKMPNGKLSNGKITNIICYPNLRNQLGKDTDEKSIANTM